MAREEDQQTAERGQASPEAEDHAALVAQLRAELEAARSQVRDAWERYRRKAGGGSSLQAVAPVLLAVLAQAS
jgi:uncharacterized protein YifE (UPF0438 family)